MRKLTIEILMSEDSYQEFRGTGNPTRELEEQLQARLEFFPSPDGGEVVTKSVRLISDEPVNGDMSCEVCGRDDVVEQIGGPRCSRHRHQR